jgi:hypothetical protein
VVLRELGLHIFLTLKNRGDIALQLDDFTGHGHHGPRADKVAGNGAGKHSAREEENVTNTHDQDLRKLGMGWGHFEIKSGLRPNYQM